MTEIAKWHCVVCGYDAENDKIFLFSGDRETGTTTWQTADVDPGGIVGVNITTDYIGWMHSGEGWVSPVSSNPAFANHQLWTDQALTVEQCAGYFNDGEGWKPTISPVTYTLDATFHRYGPAGPLGLVVDDILSDTGTDEAQIDVGKMILDGGSGTLENEYFEVATSSNFLGDNIISELEAGLVFEAEYDDNGAVSDVYNGGNRSYLDNLSEGMRRRYTHDTIRCMSSGGTAFDISYVNTGIENAKVVYGGFNGSGEPDPAGTEGWIGIYDGGNDRINRCPTNGNYNTLSLDCSQRDRTTTQSCETVR